MHLETHLKICSTKKHKVDVVVVVSRTNKMSYIKWRLIAYTPTTHIHLLLNAKHCAATAACPFLFTHTHTAKCLL